MAANKETRILKSNTLEQFRQKSNEISLHLGDNEQLGGQFADKVYNLVDVSAGSMRFFGNDDNSKTIRFEIKPEESLDNTAGYLILNDVSSLTGFVVGATVSQSGGFGATVVSSTTEKILLTNTSGVYNSTQDITDNSSNTIAAANHDRLHSEGFSVGVVKVYKNNVELNQDLSAGGFHVATLAARLNLTGAPDVSEVTEGTVLNQSGGFSGTVLHASATQLLFKSTTGSFSTSTALRFSNNSDAIVVAKFSGSLVSYDTAYGNAIELNTPASANDDIKIFSANLVDALNELQGDVGSVESLTTTATTLQGAINEHDAELGTITAGAMGTAASTVSGAIAEHETQIGNVNINSIASGNNTITGALVQLDTDIGTPTSLTTNATNNLVSAINEIDAVFDASTKSIDSGSAFTVNVTGDFTVDASDDIKLDADGGDVILKDGGTQYGRFSQMIGGLAIGAGSGTEVPVLLSSNKITSFVDVQLGDDEKLIIGDGASGNLQVFHDGTNSYLDDVAEGNLILRTNGSSVKMMAGSEDMVVATKDGAVDLYHNGVKKLETKVDGVDVIGELQSDSLDVDGNGDVSGNLNIGGNSTVTGNLTVNGTTVDINANADVSGTMAVGSTLGVTGVTTLADNLVLSDGNIDVTGTITASGEVQGGSLDVNGVADISGNLTIGSLNTSSQHVRGSINELHTELGDIAALNSTFTNDSNLVAALNELQTEVGANSFVGGGPADTANPSNLTSAINAIDAEIGDTSYTGSDVTGAIATAQTNIGTIGSLATSAGNLVAAVNELHGEVNTNATNITGNDTDIATINTNIGSLGSLTTSVTSSIVNAINSVENEVDALQTFQTTTNTNIGTIGNLGTSASSLVTAINELHGEINSNDTDISNLQSGKLSLSSGSSQTIASNLSFTGSGKTLTFASGTTLDISAATLTIGGGGGTLNFNTAFVELDVDSNQQGIKVKRESITGVANGSANAQLRWNEGISDQALGWEVVYPNPSDDGGSITSSLVTFENARSLISGTETGISVSFDDTNNRYNFGVSVDNSTIEIASGNLRVKDSGITTAKINNSAVTTGKINALAVTTAKIANSAVTNAKLQHDHFTVSDGSTTTDIALNDTLTFSGTTNEVTVGESSGTITIGLPNNVTIAGNLIVNGTTTTINTANLDIEDTTVRFAKNATTLTATNNAGLEFGASSSKPTILWDNGNTRLTTNKEFHSSVGFNGVGTNLTALNASNISSGTINDARLPATITSNITGNVTGNVTGNASTATTAGGLTTAQTFALTGDVTGTVNDDLVNGFSIATNIAANTVGPSEMIVGGTASDGKAIVYQSGAHQYSAISTTDTNTKYVINTVTSGSNAIIRLTSTGDDAGVTDDVTLAAGSNITLSESGDTITIASTQATVNNPAITIGAGALIDTSNDNNFTLNQSGAQTINVSVDLTELALETADVAGTDHLVYIDNGTQKKIAFSNVNLSAFDNTASGFTTNTGTVTSVATGTGLDGSFSTSGTITLDLSELTDMTQAVVGTQDELILLDNGAERRKLISEITLSDFNNDSGFVTSSGVTSVTGTSPIASSGGTTPAISINLDLLPDMTQTWGNSVDEFIVLDNGTQKKKRSAEIPLSAFNNDGGFTNNLGDITSITITAGEGLSGNVTTTSGDHNQTINLDHLGFEDLTDPNDDRIAYWDDSAQKFEWLDIGTNLSITAGGVLNAASTNVATNLGNSTTTTAVTITSSDGNNTTIGAVSGSAAGVMTSAQLTTLNGLVSDTGTPAILSNGTVPSLNSGISASEVRSLISAGSMSSWTLTDAVSATESIGNNETINLSDTAYVDLRITGSANARSIQASLNNSFLAFKSFLLHDSSGNLINTITADNQQDTFTFKEGTNIDLTSSGDTLTIATTAQVNQNAYAQFKTFNSGTTAQTHNAANTGDDFSLNFKNGIQTSEYGSGTSGSIVELATDQRRSSYAGDIYLGHAHATAKSYIKLHSAVASGDTGYIDFYTSETTSSNPTHEFRMANNGDFHADGDVLAFSTTVASDAKLKTNVNKVENALDKVSQLDGVTFEWIRDGKESAGVIAQNVEDVLPSAVKEVESLKVEGETHKSVDYNQLSSLFIEAIKELKEQNIELKAEVEKLKSINSNS